jgi:hypothetical protein
LGGFESWIAALWPDRHDLIAIDGKTSRRTHDKRKGLKTLHTLSARRRDIVARLEAAAVGVFDEIMHFQDRLYGGEARLSGVAAIGAYPIDNARGGVGARLDMTTSSAAGASLK